LTSKIISWLIIQSHILNHFLKYMAVPLPPTVPVSQWLHKNGPFYCSAKSKTFETNFLIRWRHCPYFGENFYFANLKFRDIHCFQWHCRNDWVTPKIRQNFPII
jgi:hypothetical protein